MKVNQPASMLSLASSEAHNHNVHDTNPYIDVAQLEAAGPTITPPCDHNCWTRSRRRRVLPGVRLRCVVCRLLWITRLSEHKKCPGFYSGSCKGDCGNPHILARGTVPKGLEHTAKAERLNTRCLKDLVKLPARRGKRAKMLAVMPAPLEVEVPQMTAVLSEISISEKGSFSPSSEGYQTPRHAEKGDLEGAAEEADPAEDSGASAVGTPDARRTPSLVSVASSVRSGSGGSQDDLGGGSAHLAHSVSSVATTSTGVFRHDPYCELSGVFLYGGEEA